MDGQNMWEIEHSCTAEGYKIIAALMKREEVL